MASRIGEKIHLLHRDYVTDKLWQEDSTNSHQGKATYHDHFGKDHRKSDVPGLYVEVEYDTHHLEPYRPKSNFQGESKTFSTREALLEHEVARRMEAVKDLPDKERYVGFRLSLLQKIKRLFNINIDGELQDQWKTILKPNYSVKNVCNMTHTIHPSKEIRQQLHLEAHETYKLGTRIIWAFNSTLNGYEYFDETGKKIRIQSAITSSNDRTASNICMMRRLEDDETGETLAYTGRPDTKAKAIEQIEFIFRSEINKSQPKGLIKKEGVYSLTYVVNNLLSPMTGIGHITFDEKKATLDEQQLFCELKEQVFIIDGKKVQVNPIYFSQPFNQTTSFATIISESHSGIGLSKKINTVGYNTLIPMAEIQLRTMDTSNKKSLLEGAIHILKKDFSTLLPEQEFFNRAVICQALNLPLVVHCKSSIDRTTLALATALVSHQWNKLDLDVIRNSEGQVIPHLILQNEAAKELIAGHCLSGHQVTRVARTCEGSVKGHTLGTKTLGFEWASNPIAGRILPARYTKVEEVSFFKKGLSGALSIIGFLINLALAIPIWLIGTIVQQNPFFNPIYIKPGVLPTERTIDITSPYVGSGSGRSLIKPSGMVTL